MGAHGQLIAADGRSFALVRALHRGSSESIWLVRGAREELAARILTTDSPFDRGDFSARSERLLRLRSLIKSPQVVELRGVASSPAGHPALLMGYAQHGSVAQLSERLSASGRRLPLAHTQYYALCLTRALRGIHRAGLLHRDVSPGALLIDSNGRARLGALERLRPVDEIEPGLGLRGTPGFVAPEVLAGEEGVQGDLFALGATLYFMLGGAAPPQGERQGRPDGRVVATALDALPRSWRAVVGALLAPRPGDRPRDADAVVQQLKAIPWASQERNWDLPPLPGGVSSSTAELRPVAAPASFVLAEVERATPRPEVSAPALGQRELKTMAIPSKAIREILASGPPPEADPAADRAAEERLRAQRQRQAAQREQAQREQARKEQARKEQQVRQRAEQQVRQRAERQARFEAQQRAEQQARFEAQQRAEQQRAEQQRADQQRADQQRAEQQRQAAEERARAARFEAQQRAQEEERSRARSARREEREAEARAEQERVRRFEEQQARERAEREEQEAARREAEQQKAAERQRQSAAGEATPAPAPATRGWLKWSAAALLLGALAAALLWWFQRPTGPRGLQELAAICPDGDVDRCFRRASTRRSEDPVEAVLLFGALRGMGLGRADLGLRATAAELSEAQRAELEAGLGLLCESGDGASCGLAGWLAWQGERTSEARGRAERGCDGGDSFSCEVLAELMLIGTDLPAPAPDEALRILTAGCAAEHAPACVRIGQLRAPGGPIQRLDSEAVTLFEGACEAGYLPGCVELGRLYELGRGVERSYQEAQQRYASACEQGALAGCVRLAQMHAGGRLGIPDYAEAVALSRRGCLGGAAEGCAVWGSLFESGRGLTPDPARARELLEQACAAGSTVGCVELAGARAAGRLGSEPDAPGAAAILDPLCERGAGAACRVLSGLVGRGQLGVPDPVRADELLRRSCETLGDPLGCVARAAALMEHDRPAALALLEAGCSEGEPAACGLLGRWEGAAERAAELLERACERGDAGACLAQAEQVAVRGGTERQLLGALQQLRQACSMGLAAGCRVMASWIEAGRGVEPDAQQARVSLLRACELGDARACLEVGRAETGQLGLDQLSRACRLGSGAACALADERGAPGERLGERACQLGVTRACVALGDAALAAGEAAASASWFQLGCQPPGQAAADGYACRRLAQSSEDPATAYRTLQRACEAGDWPGCRLQAQAQMAGEGAQRNIEAGLALLGSTCRIGEDGAACGLLAPYLAEGELLRTNLREAADYADRGCRADVPEACALAAELFASGRGVRRNPTRADEFRARACELGVSAACAEE